MFLVLLTLFALLGVGRSQYDQHGSNTGAYGSGGYNTGGYQAGSSGSMGQYNQGYPTSGNTQTYSQGQNGQYQQGQYLNGQPTSQNYRVSNAYSAYSTNSPVGQNGAYARMNTEAVDNGEETSYNSGVTASGSAQSSTRYGGLYVRRNDSPRIGASIYICVAVVFLWL